MPFKINVRIADVVVQFIADCEDDIRDISETFRHHLLSEGDVVVDHTIEIRREIGFSLPKSAKKSWDVRYLGAYRPVHWLLPFLKTKRYHSVRYLDEAAGKEYYRYNGPDKWIETDIKAYRTVCHFIESRFLGRSAQPKLDMAIIFAMHRVLALHGRFSAHSAAVEIDGKCYCFLGTSGSGKSTLCTDLVRNHGAKYLGDDVVYWYLDDKGRVMVGAFFMPAKLFAESSFYKSSFDILDEHPESRCEAAPLSAFFLVRQTRVGRSEIEPMTKSDLLATFARSTSSATLLHDKAAWTALMFQACEMPFYKFKFGDRKQLDTEVFADA